MHTVNLENQIISKMRELDQEEQAKLLDYLKTRAPKRHSTNRYKRKALRQIRTALSES
ncbi:MAG: hypothetical protein ACO2ZZ_01135 [Cyclobacteriaceae bacterium]